jgi:hypothetical protein
MNRDTCESCVHRTYCMKAGQGCWCANHTTTEQALRNYRRQEQRRYEALLRSVQNPYADWQKG